MFKLTSKKISLIILTLLLLGGLFFGFLPQAQALQIADYPSFLNIRVGMTLTELVSGIFGFLLMVAGLAAFIMIVWGGVNYLTSVGDPSRIGDAKNQIFSAILGLIIMFASWMILNTINPQLVELKEPDVLNAPEAGPITPIVNVGGCVAGQSYAVETYSSVNYSGDHRCYGAGTDEKNFNKKIYSIKINGGAVKLFEEPSYGGRNICFQGSILNLNKCAYSDNWLPGWGGWEGEVRSLQIVASCEAPDTTLEMDGTPAIDNQPCICHPGFR